MRQRNCWSLVVALILPTEVFAAVTIDPLSARSLFLVTRTNGTNLGTATGFVVNGKNKPFLITNWHVVSGRNPNDNSIRDPLGRIPNEVVVSHNANRLGDRILRIEALLSTNGVARWIEHGKGQVVDVVALPLEKVDSQVKLHPLDLSLADHEMSVLVAMPVSIIGFPLGLSAGRGFPIWKTGHIASEPETDFNDQPVFVIDATTRSGMSGSPVVSRAYGSYSKRNGDWTMGTGVSTRFLGVYSAQNQDSELGLVWRPEAIRDLLRIADNQNP